MGASVEAPGSTRTHLTPRRRSYARYGSPGARRLDGARSDAAAARSVDGRSGILRSRPGTVRTPAIAARRSAMGCVRLLRGTGPRGAWPGNPGESPFMSTREQVVIRLEGVFDAAAA